MGEDLSRPGLVDTPTRAEEAYKFLTRGYHQTLDEVVNGALFPSDSNEMVLVKDIELYSMRGTMTARILGIKSVKPHSHGVKMGVYVPDLHNHAAVIQ